ncbi:MAG: hypothetical protein HDT27_04960 [Subdoligranulum sp.]|nr:hypothetical protein [Subdoligranulum sp.]
MKIYGREYRFRLSVSAAMEITAMCPEKKLEKLEALVNKGTIEALDVICTIAEIESRAYEQAKAFETGESPQPHLTREIAQSLDFKQIKQLTKEVMEAFHSDGKQTVEVDAEAAKKKAETAESEEPPSGSE